MTDPLSIRPQTLLRLLTAASCLSSAAHAGEAWILRPEDPWSYGWEERLLASRDGSSLPGFSRTALPVAPGLWGEVGLGVRGASEGRGAVVPGAAPLPRGASAVAYADAWLAAGPLFLHLRPEAVLSPDDGGEVAQPITREAWTGRATETTVDAVETAPRATLGVTGLGHVLALSNEPFRWGEGIFGGVAMGQAWSGFPHVVLATRGPQGPDPEGPLGRLAVGYEMVLGRVDTAAGIEAATIAGFRSALRWEAVTLSWTRMLIDGGRGQPSLSNRTLARNLLFWRSGNDGPAATPDAPDPNRFAALGLRVDWPTALAWSVEYGIDDQNGKVADQAIDTTLTQEARWTSATWTATVDWLDVTGDGDWRVAAEWFRAESYVYGHARYPWDVDGRPLAHADGGNAHSARLLVQHLDGDDARWTVVGGWRRQGMRNAESGNPNTARKETGVPGSSTFARVPWDRISADLRYERPLDGGWRWWLEAGGAWDENRDFGDGQRGASGSMGLGFSRAW
jgi:hypothetical protein